MILFTIRFGLLLIIGLLCVFVYLASKNVYGQPSVQISPTCGPSSPGFSLSINANGFKPDSTVKWKLVDSLGRIPLYGYFQSNNNGGFQDVTFFDDLIPGIYKMYFGTDIHSKNLYLSGNGILSVDITIPCPTGHQVNGNATATASTSDIPGAKIVLLSQKLKIGQGDNNNIVGEVKNVGNDTAISVRIGFTSYDNNGDVTGTDFVYSTADTLDPNQKSSFNLLSSKDNFVCMSHYELSLQWRDFDGTDQYVENAPIYKINTTRQ